jgi:DNA-binding transcriptional MerR regulator
MKPSTLTISQLAASVGVTVRAVRHYHARGLLPEPARDDSGYRRYNAQAVVDLIRIKTLAEAGVPLARIGPLLDAAPEEFTAAIADIDRTLRTTIRDMQERRRRLADLAEGEGLFLSADVVELLDELRAMGVSNASVQIERDGWILMAAVLPEAVTEWVAGKRAALEDPFFRRLYVACGESLDWDIGDPRLEALAATLVDFALQHQAAGNAQPDWTSDDQVGVGVLWAYISDVSPAWRRLNEIVEQRLRDLGHPRVSGASQQDR